jgi:Uma2 family endonuclease
MRMGIIPEDASTELLNGMIVLKDRSARDGDPMTIGNDHRICVQRFAKLSARIDNELRHVESQQPLVCSDIHVPEPDFMVLRGTLESYTDLPVAADAYCIAEVADSSYERDSGTKLVAYARAGVEQYIIINLRNRTAEVYMSPNESTGTYAAPLTLSVNDSLSLRVGDIDRFEVPLSELLP